VYTKPKEKQSKANLTFSSPRMNFIKTPLFGSDLTGWSHFLTPVSAEHALDAALAQIKG
jgi:hypothetical protein